MLNLNVLRIRIRAGPEMVGYVKSHSYGIIHQMIHYDKSDMERLGVLKGDGDLVTLALPHRGETHTDPTDRTGLIRIIRISLSSLSIFLFLMMERITK